MWSELFERVLGIVFTAIDRMLALPAIIVGLTSSNAIRSLGGVVAFTGLIVIALANTLAEITSDGIAARLSFLIRPEIAVLAIWAAMMVGVSVNRAWSLNEQLRTKIADGVVTLDPDQLPDLRFLAFISALLVAALIPVSLFVTNRYSCGIGECLFVVSKAGLEPWIAYSTDLVVRVIGFFGVPDVYGFPSPVDVRPRHVGALHLVMLSRLVIGFIVLATIFELYRISATVGRAMQALSESPAAATRLGVRAIASLLVHLKENTGLGDDPRVVAADDPNKVARNASIALGQIGHPKALSLLRAIVDHRRIHDRVRRRAMDAIISIVRKMKSRSGEVWWLERLLISRKLSQVGRWAENALRLETELGKKGIVAEALEELCRSLGTSDAVVQSNRVAASQTLERLKLAA